MTTTTDKPLKIIRLEAQNIQRLKAVEIEPNGNVVILAGRNGQGKSSVLKSIEMALGGKETFSDRPIRDGQSKGRIVCDLGDLVVTRTFTAAGGGSLVVTSKDGAKYSSPQSILDGLVGKLAFDPLAFVRMRPDKQVETLRTLVGLDFTVMDDQRKKFYDERTQVGRDLVKAKAILESAPFYEDAPAEEQSAEQIVTEINRAHEQNKRNEQCRAALRESEGDVTRIEDRIVEIQKTIADLEAKLAEAKAALDRERTNLKDQQTEFVQRREAVAKLQDIDTKPLTDKIATLDALNAKVRANKRHAELKAEVQRLEKQQATLTACIEEIDRDKAEELAQAEFPLPGLSFSDSSVLLNGVPFSQASQAEQIKASVAIGLCLNPKLRIILVRDGSLLDDDSLEAMAEIAAKNDAQIWLERVASGADGCSVYIDDGMIKGAEPEEEMALAGAGREGLETAE